MNPTINLLYFVSRRDKGISDTYYQQGKVPLVLFDFYRSEAKFYVSHCSVLVVLTVTHVGNLRDPWTV